jgi:predicted nucleic acid-binding protein
MDIVLAPDVFVNASVALGSPPDKVIRRVLGNHKGESKSSEWVLQRVAAMLSATPSFKKEAVETQLELIRGFVQVIVAEDGESKPDAWEEALVALAKAATARRVITDHPDLLQKESSNGIDFVSTEAWLLEQSIPPPFPTDTQK